MDTDFLFQVMSERENELEKRVLTLVERMNAESYADITKRLNDVDAETKLKIAFVGQHNAGKSTIVSALTNDSSIKISSNVETDTTTAYKWGEVYLYDTPGLRAGVKDEHDKSALEAIREADLLIFCITSSLFDDLMIKDFIDLAYVRNYKCKMLLVVNKMSQEDSEFEELVKNYNHTLSETLSQYGGDLEDFPIAYIDAKDYKDGVLEDDEELIEFSNFNSFVDILNLQIAERGLIAKVITKCSVLLDAVTFLVSNTGTELDRNLGMVLNRLKRSVRNHKKQMSSEINLQKMQLRADIMDIGDTITDKIGSEDIKDEDVEKINHEIECVVDKTINEIENLLEMSNKELIEEMGDILTSDIGSYVFDSISSGKYNANSKISSNYSSLVEKVGEASKIIGAGGEKIAQMALKTGAKDFSKLASSSGSTMHTLVLNVGHFFGAKFKPYQAVKIANKIGTVAKVLGPIMGVVDVALGVVDKVGSEKRNADIQKAKSSSHNSMSSIASDIVREIEKQYELMEKETFDVFEADIEKMQQDIISEAKNNSEQVEELKRISTELRSLMNTL